MTNYCAEIESTESNFGGANIGGRSQ
jgi:hypothetical protein